MLPNAHDTGMLYGHIGNEYGRFCVGELNDGELTVFLVGLFLFSLPYALLMIMLIRDLGKEIERYANREATQQHHRLRQQRQSWEQGVAPLKRALIDIAAINELLDELRVLQRLQREAVARNDHQRVTELLDAIEGVYERFLATVQRFEEQQVAGETLWLQSEDFERWLRTEYLITYSRYDRARAAGNSEAMLQLRAKLLLLEDELEQLYGPR